MYELRNYRNLSMSNLIKYNVTIGESDLEIFSTKHEEDLVLKRLRRIRGVITRTIRDNPIFQNSLSPIDIETNDDIIKKMINASNKAHVGPMASVAGCVSEEIGKELLKTSDEVIIENGGDIFLSLNNDSKVRIHTTNHYFKDRISVELKKELFPLGICTSSGTMGHSLSFGKADSVTVISKNTYLADALATSLCNKVKKSADIDWVIEEAKDYNDLIGIVIICGDKIGFWGNIKITTS